MFENKILRNLIDCFDSLGLNDIFYTLIVMSCISHIGKCESHQSKIILQSMGLLLSLECIYDLYDILKCYITTLDHFVFIEKLEIHASKDCCKSINMFVTVLKYSRGKYELDSNREASNFEMRAL